MKKQFYLILSILLLYSCSNKDCKIKYYDNGNIKFIQHYSNGQLNGESIWFYPSGISEQKCLYKDGKLDGEFIYFYPNGSIKGKERYKDGKVSGNAHTFYPSGALQNHRFWVNDTMTGYFCDYFDESADIIKSILLIDKHGHLIFRKTFDEYGNIIKIEGKEPREISY